MDSLEPSRSAALRQRLAGYQWYHRLQVADGIWTLDETQVQDYQQIWDLILEGMNHIDFRDKRVLDVGCRDGLFSLEAEKRGAAEVVGIDNDLSRGAVDVVLPFLGSKVQMYGMNVYDLTPEVMGYYDVILFPGVLYHLRHPSWALKKLTDCLCFPGVLAVEAAMLADMRYDEHSFLYCPSIEEDPLEDWTACTLFNRKGLSSVLSSMSCRLTYASALEFEPPEEPSGTPRTNRQFLLFEKDTALAARPGMDWLDRYWHGTHAYHTTGEVS